MNTDNDIILKYLAENPGLDEQLKSGLTNLANGLNNLYLDTSYLSKTIQNAIKPDKDSQKKIQNVYTELSDKLKIKTTEISDILSKSLNIDDSIKKKIDTSVSGFMAKLSKLENAKVNIDGKIDLNSLFFVADPKRGLFYKNKYEKILQSTLDNISKNIEKVSVNATVDFKQLFDNAKLSKNFNKQIEPLLLKTIQNIFAKLENTGIKPSGAISLFSDIFNSLRPTKDTVLKVNSIFDSTARKVFNRLKTATDQISDSDMTSSVKAFIDKNFVNIRETMATVASVKPSKSRAFADDEEVMKVKITDIDESAAGKILPESFMQKLSKYFKGGINKETGEHESGLFDRLKTWVPWIAGGVLAYLANPTAFKEALSKIKETVSRIGHFIYDEILPDKLRNFIDNSIKFVKDEFPIITTKLATAWNFIKEHADTIAMISGLGGLLTGSLSWGTIGAVGSILRFLPLPVAGTIMATLIGLVAINELHKSLDKQESKEIQKNIDTIQKPATEAQDKIMERISSAKLNVKNPGDVPKITRIMTEELSNVNSDVATQVIDNLSLRKPMVDKNVYRIMKNAESLHWNDKDLYNNFIKNNSADELIGMYLSLKENERSTDIGRALGAAIYQKSEKKIDLKQNGYSNKWFIDNVENNQFNKKPSTTMGFPVNDFFAVGKNDNITVHPIDNNDDVYVTGGKDGGVLDNNNKSILKELSELKGSILDLKRALVAAIKDQTINMPIINQQNSGQTANVNTGGVNPSHEQDIREPAFDIINNYRMKVHKRLSELV